MKGLLIIALFIVNISFVFSQQQEAKPERKEGRANMERRNQNGPRNNNSRQGNIRNTSRQGQGRVQRTKNESYAEIIGKKKGSTFTISLESSQDTTDFGGSDPMEKALKDIQASKSMSEAMTKMSKNGWSFEQAYVLEGKTKEIRWIISRKTREQYSR